LWSIGRTRRGFRPPAEPSPGQGGLTGFTTKTVNQDGPCWPFSVPEVGAGPSCRAIVKPDNVRLVPARKNHRADRTRRLWRLGWLTGRNDDGVHDLVGEGLALGAVPDWEQPAEVAGRAVGVLRSVWFQIQVAKSVFRIMQCTPFTMSTTWLISKSAAADR